MRRPALFPRTLAGRIGAVLALLACVLGGFLAAAGFFDRDPVHFFGSESDARIPLAGVLFSGDMGLRFGMGAHVAATFVDAHVPVVGISSPTVFGMHRTRAQVDAIVANAIRQTLDRTHADRIIVIGQSFGADIARVGLSDLPADLRPRVAAAVLVVPGEAAYFRADPSGLGYHGRPDAGTEGLDALGWMPLVCIRGAKEPDSLCPWLRTANVRAFTLPGGHYLRKDHALLSGTILRALHPLLEQTGGSR